MDVGCEVCGKDLDEFVLWSQKEPYLIKAAVESKENDNLDVTCGIAKSITDEIFKKYKILFDNL